jgi:hypothetical protein
VVGRLGWSEGHLRFECSWEWLFGVCWEKGSSGCGEFECIAILRVAQDDSSCSFIVEIDCVGVSSRWMA